MNQWIMGSAALLLTIGGPASAAGEVREPVGKPVWKSERQLTETQRGWDDIVAGDHESATAHFEKVIDRTRSPYERSQALFGLAQIALIEQNLDEALKLYKETIRLDRLPNVSHFTTMLRIAEIHLLAERRGEAKAWLERWRREHAEATDEELAQADRLAEQIDGETSETDTSPA